ncbi:MAG: 50S ribosomal protein L11 methyltransferase [Bacillota bacterium]|nr:50S ribosomal protein L11 methyltransferase [Bacillota bacterium]
MNGEWLEINIITDSKWIEVMTGILYSLDVKGIAIEDPNDILEKENNPLSWDYADLNILKYKGKKSVVTGYFDAGSDEKDITLKIEDKIKDLEQAGYHIGDYEITNKSIYEEDWANNWKKYYKTTKIGEKIVVVPIWESYTPKDGEAVIKMDPGMAFGTGTHETTRMCIRALERQVKSNSEVFDIGTGSGILSIAASKLGAKKVTAVDLDRVAVDAARDNVSFNNINNVEVLNGNLMDLVKGKADIVVANIIADIIMLLAKDVKNYLKDDGVFISSGIIKDRKDDVIEKLKTEGYNILNVSEEGEWVAIEANIKGD